MPSFRYRLLNVFADATFTGNPLCVFEDGSGLDDETMLNLARQFNLSETVFLCPADEGDARMRIFTPTAELPFAGHPSIGSAHVMQQLHGFDETTLQCKAGKVALRFDGARWLLTAPRKAADTVIRPCEETLSTLCRMLQLEENDVAAPPQWVDSGSEQLLLPLKSPDAVRKARPTDNFAEAWPANQLGRRVVFLFAFESPVSPGSPGPSVATRAAITARYFFRSANGVVEDPGTGSACVNLGAWLHARKRPLPMHYEISQGDAIGRPCRILLDVMGDGEIRIGGRVIELGAGTISL